MRRADDVFAVDDRFRQRLLLKALEQMDATEETPAETRAIVSMVIELERMLDGTSETERERRRRQGRERNRRMRERRKRDAA